jgi:shikimate dehydrogenase
MFESVNTGSCAVIGKPIKHSLSPQIHQQFASQFDMTIDYQRLSCEPEDFALTVQAFFAAGGKGMNVTTPFKEAARAIADDVSPESQLANSCNTLFMREGLLCGITTDGDGWLEDIERLAIRLASSRILLLGVGGASRIILQKLLSLPRDSAPAEIVIANRTESKIAPLLTDKRLSGYGLFDIPGTSYDLIINGLSTGWQDSFPELQPGLANGATGYDLNYGQGAEPFKHWFMKQGAQCYDGWGMLVNQAALSFATWWHKKPDTKALIEAGPGVLKDQPY